MPFNSNNKGGTFAVHEKGVLLDYFSSGKLCPGTEVGIHRIPRKPAVPDRYITVPLLGFLLLQVDDEVSRLLHADLGVGGQPRSPSGNPAGKSGRLR